MPIIALSVVLGAPVSEPYFPIANANSHALMVSEPNMDKTPLNMRLSSGYLSVPHANQKDLHMVYSDLALSTEVVKSLGLDAFVRSRVLIGDAMASMPDRAQLQLRYVPSFLDFNKVRIGLIGGGSFGAEMKNDSPGRGVGDIDLGFTTSVRLGFLTVVGQGRAGWGINRKIDMGNTQELPAQGAIALVGALPFWEMNMSAEFGARGDLKRSERSWDILSLLSLSLPVTNVARVHLAGSAFRVRRGKFVFGGLLAISGRLGLGDLDEDGILDKFDACPNDLGTEQYFGCPFVDEDSDKVWDRIDACPDKLGTESNAGCPLKDTDQDGIIDLDDPCPESKKCNLTK